jgi:hypothetical protein
LYARRGGGGATAGASTGLAADHPPLPHPYQRGIGGVGCDAVRVLDGKALELIIKLQQAYDELGGRLPSELGCLMYVVRALSATLEAKKLGKEFFDRDVMGKLRDVVLSLRAVIADADEPLIVAEGPHVQQAVVHSLRRLMALGKKQRREAQDLIVPLWLVLHQLLKRREHMTSETPAASDAADDGDGAMDVDTTEMVSVGAMDVGTAKMDGVGATCEAGGAQTAIKTDDQHESDVVADTNSGDGSSDDGSSGEEETEEETDAEEEDTPPASALFLTSVHALLHSTDLCGGCNRLLHEVLANDVLPHRCVTGCGVTWHDVT